MTPALARPTIGLLVLAVRAARIEAESPCGAQPAATIIRTAHARHAWADMLARRDAPDDRERALALVGQSLSAAESMGMTRLSQQALALKVRLQGILGA